MGIPNAQGGPAVNQLVGERLQPAKQHGLLSTPEHCWYCRLEQVRSALEILGGQRVADCIGRRTTTLEPLAGAAMQRSYLTGLLRDQMRMENFGKEVVIAIPVPLIIQRN